MQVECFCEFALCYMFYAIFYYLVISILQFRLVIKLQIDASDLY